MVQTSKIDLLNARLEAAKVERYAIDAELAQLQHGDPDTPFKFFNLVGRRHLIADRLLAAVEALESTGSLAPETSLELDTEAYDVAPPTHSGRGSDKTHHQVA
jgi:hypothetical protein